MLAVSTSLASSERTLALPPGVAKAVGVHPARAAEAAGEDWLEQLRQLAVQPGVVAIGEGGFDDTGPDWALQHRCFAGQLAIAAELRLPLVLHIDGERAWKQFVASQAASGPRRTIRHYFRGDQRQAEWHAVRGHYVSFGRPLLRDPALQAIAAGYPAELLLIETDSYPLPGRTTEPKDLVPVGELLAQLRGWSTAECAERLWANSLGALGTERGPVEGRSV
jgi:TatD DNase family protein